LRRKKKQIASLALAMTKIMTSPQPSAVGEGVKFPPLEGRTKEGSLDTAHDRLLRMIRGLTPPYPPLRGEGGKRHLEQVERVAGN